MKSNQLTNSEALIWWESKRIIYNAFLLLILIIIYLKHSTSTQEISLISAMIWIFGANIFFTMSWAFEILVFRIMNKYPFNKTTRIILLAIGTLFSMWWTLLNL